MKKQLKVKGGGGGVSYRIIREQEGHYLNSNRKKQVDLTLDTIYTKTAGSIPCDQVIEVKAPSAQPKIIDEQKELYDPTKAIVSLPQGQEIELDLTPYLDDSKVLVEGSKRQIETLKLSSVRMDRQEQYVKLAYETKKPKVTQTTQRDQDVVISSPIKASRKKEPVGKTTRDAIKPTIYPQKVQEEKKIKTGRGADDTKESKPPMIPKAIHSSKQVSNVVEKVTEDGIDSDQRFGMIPEEQQQQQLSDYHTATFKPISDQIAEVSSKESLSQQQKAISSHFKKQAVVENIESDSPSAEQDDLGALRQDIEDKEVSDASRAARTPVQFEKSSAISSLNITATPRVAGAFEEDSGVKYAPETETIMGLVKLSLRLKLELFRYCKITSGSILLDLIKHGLRQQLKMNLKRYRQAKTQTILTIMKRWFRSEIYKNLQTIATFPKQEPMKSPGQKKTVRAPQSVAGFTSKADLQQIEENISTVRRGDENEYSHVSSKEFGELLNNFREQEMIETLKRQQLFEQSLHRDQDQLLKMSRLNPKLVHIHRIVYEKAPQVVDALQTSRMQVKDLQQEPHVVTPESRRKVKHQAALKEKKAAHKKAKPSQRAPDYVNALKKEPKIVTELIEEDVSAPKLLGIQESPERDEKIDTPDNKIDQIVDVAVSKEAAMETPSNHVLNEQLEQVQPPQNEDLPQSEAVYHQSKDKLNYSQVSDSKIISLHGVKVNPAQNLFDHVDISFSLPSKDALQTHRFQESMQNESGMVTNKASVMAGMNSEGLEKSNQTSFKLNLASLKPMSPSETPDESTQRLGYKTSLKKNANELEPGFYHVEPEPEVKQPVKRKELEPLVKTPVQKKEQPNPLLNLFSPKPKQVQKNLEDSPDTIAITQEVSTGYVSNLLSKFKVQLVKHVQVKKEQIKTEQQQKENQSQKLALFVQEQEAKKKTKEEEQTSIKRKQEEAEIVNQSSARDYISKLTLQVSVSSSRIEKKEDEKVEKSQFQKQEQSVKVEEEDTQVLQPKTEQTLKESVRVIEIDEKNDFVMLDRRVSLQSEAIPKSMPHYSDIATEIKSLQVSVEKRASQFRAMEAQSELKQSSVKSSVHPSEVVIQKPTSQRSGNQKEHVIQNQMAQLKQQQQELEELRDQVVTEEVSQDFILQLMSKAQSQKPLQLPNFPTGVYSVLERSRQIDIIYFEKSPKVTQPKKRKSLRQDTLDLDHLHKSPEDQEQQKAEEIMIKSPEPPIVTQSQQTKPVQKPKQQEIKQSKPPMTPQNVTSKRQKAEVVVQQQQQTESILAQSPDLTATDQLTITESKESTVPRNFHYQQQQQQKVRIQRNTRSQARQSTQSAQRTAKANTRERVTQSEQRVLAMAAAAQAQAQAAYNAIAQIQMGAPITGDPHNIAFIGQSPLTKNQISLEEAQIKQNKLLRQFQLQTEKLHQLISIQNRQQLQLMELNKKFVVVKKKNRKYLSQPQQKQYEASTASLWNPMNHQNPLDYQMIQSIGSDSKGFATRNVHNQLLRTQGAGFPTFSQEQLPTTKQVRIVSAQGRVKSGLRSSSHGHQGQNIVEMRPSLLPDIVEGGSLKQSERKRHKKLQKEASQTQKKLQTLNNQGSQLSKKRMKQLNSAKSLRKIDKIYAKDWNNQLNMPLFMESKTPDLKFKKKMSVMSVRKANGAIFESVSKKKTMPRIDSVSESPENMHRTRKRSLEEAMSTRKFKITKYKKQTQRI